MTFKTPSYKQYPLASTVLMYKQLVSPTLPCSFHPMVPPPTGHRDPILAKLARCANSTDACRDLRRLLSHPRYSLQIEIKPTVIDVRHARTRQVQQIPWPTLPLTSWVRYIMEVQGGQLLLGGHHISQTNLWANDLKEFWDLYEHVDPTHLTFTLPEGERVHTIPYFVHGDEGRGRTKQAVMVFSFQCILSHYGRTRLNESGLLGFYWLNIFFHN